MFYDFMSRKSFAPGNCCCVCGGEEGGVGGRGGGGLHFKKFGNIHIPRPAFQNPNVESMDELGKPMS